MNWVDIIIVIFLAVLTILGFKRGLVKSLFPLVGIVLGIFLAGRFQNTLAGKLTFIDSESAAKIVAFAAIVAAVFLAVTVVGSIMRGILRTVLLGWVDRLGGAVFGFTVGWFICSVIVVLLAKYAAAGGPGFLHLDGIQQSICSAIKDSTLATAQIRYFPVILSLLPDKFDSVKEFFG